MIKKYISLLLFIPFFAFGQNTEVTLTVANQSITGTDYYFDIYLKSTANGPLYLGPSDFIFSFDETKFSSPTITKQSGFSTFAPTNAGNSTACQTNYFNALATELQPNEILVNLNLPFEPANQTQFDDNIATIDGAALTHRLGRFKISGVTTTNITDVNLAWKETGAGITSQVFSFENIGDFILKETIESFEIDFTPPTTSCTQTSVNIEDFEAGFGIWNDGGSNCFRVPTNPNSGIYSIKLRKNTTTSLMSTNSLDLTNYSELEMNLSFITEAYDAGEYFVLELSTNGGLTFTTANVWTMGTDFNNGVRENPTVTIPGPFTAATVLRFRANGNAYSEAVYIDDAVILGCLSAAQYTITTTTTGQGAITLSPPGGTYTNGTVVTMTATPDPSWQFDNWSGDASGSTNPLDITVNGNKTITADFSQSSCNAILVDNEDYEVGFGIWNDGGSNCFRVTQNPNSGMYSIKLRKNLASSSMKTNVLDLSLYSDLEVGFSYITEAFDEGEYFEIQISSDGGTTFSTASTLTKGVDFENNVRENPTITIPGPFTTTTVIQFRTFGNAYSEAVYIDDAVINGCSSGAQFTITTSTIGQGSVTLSPPGGTYVSGTVVTMTATPDPSWQFDNWSGDASGSTNPIDITVDANKTIDANFSQPTCNGVLVDNEDYEAGFGIWNDGGSNCFRVTQNPNSGMYSIKLRKNLASSSMHTNVLDLAIYSDLEVSFSFITEAFDAGEYFSIELSTDGGTTFSTSNSWVKGTDFENGVRGNPTITIPGPFTATTVLKFRTFGNAYSEAVYIDDVVINGCNSTSSKLQVKSNGDIPKAKAINKGEILVYPNPVASTKVVNIENTFDERGRFILFNASGKAIRDLFIDGKSVIKLDLDAIARGVLFYKFETSTKIKTGKLVIQ